MMMKKRILEVGSKDSNQDLRRNKRMKKIKMKLMMSNYHQEIKIKTSIRVKVQTQRRKKKLNKKTAKIKKMALQNH
jgi:hypothetical protein